MSNLGVEHQPGQHKLNYLHPSNGRCAKTLSRVALNGTVGASKVAIAKLPTWGPTLLWERRGTGLVGSFDRFGLGWNRVWLVVFFLDDPIFFKKWTLERERIGTG